jgi:nitrogen fixation-related uncharacterized protein
MEIIFFLISALVVALLFGVAALYWGDESRPVFDERREGERFGLLR